jgi:hypothetical protein
MIISRQKSGLRKSSRSHASTKFDKNSSSRSPAGGHPASLSFASYAQPWPLLGRRLGVAERLEAEVQVNDPAVIVAAEGRSVVVLWRRPIAVPVLAVISAELMPTVVAAALRTLISTVSLMSAVVATVGATVVPLVTMP